MRRSKSYYAIMFFCFVLCGFLTCYALAGTTEMVSVSSSGSQGYTDSGLGGISISADGRYIAFSSYAYNLVPEDTNIFSDILVRDRVAGTTERISVSSTGEQTNDESCHPSISADGRYVAFESCASNLVPGDTNGVSDIFVRDRVSGVTERVSISPAGEQANGHNYNPAINADGKYVFFDSQASNLVPGDTNSASDIFVRDRMEGTTERVSISSAGEQGDKSSYAPSISSDGRYAAFVSEASNFVAGDAYVRKDIFVRDRLTGITERVNVSSSGELANHQNSSHPSISADGRYVAFVSGAYNLVSGDTNWSSDAFVRDRVAGTTECVSVSPANAIASSGGYTSISGDGRYVAFTSSSSIIVPGDTHNGTDVFVRDRIAGNTERISVSLLGQKTYGLSFMPVISEDGRYAAFVSDNPILVPNDTIYFDVFTHARYVDNAKPDLLIKTGNSSYECNNIYSDDGSSQTKTQNTFIYQTTNYAFRVQNDGNVSDTFRITGTAGVCGWTVKYYDLMTNTDVTDLITGVGWNTGTIVPGATNGVYASVIPDMTVSRDTPKTLLITSVSLGDTTKKDVGRVIITPVDTSITYKPDLLFKAGRETSYSCNNIYSQDGSSQTKTLSASPNQTVSYAFRVQNDGNYYYDSFKITGPGGGDGWTVKYYDLKTNADVTLLVTTSDFGWRSGDLAPGASNGVYVKITPNDKIAAGSEKILTITAVSQGDTSVKDVCKAVTIVAPRYRTDILMKAGAETAYSFNNIYSTFDQTKSLNASTNQRVSYGFRVQNDGNTADTFKITGTAGGNGWTVVYKDLTTNEDVTAQVTDYYGWSSGSLAPGATNGVYALVTPDGTVAAGNQKALTIVAVSQSGTEVSDFCRAVTNKQ
ncbi:MAG: hypothetical protein ACYC27_03385 [Armatimonadota bacterium]